jgi:endonuclease/exonuclease/phosphatase family metal-dependent hydrolase
MTHLSLSRQRNSFITLYSILFLFFFQLLADFIESIYAFGLLSTGITAEIASVLFLFSPLVLLFTKRVSGRTMVILGEVILASRLVEVILSTRGKMFISGIGVGCFLILFPVLLWKESQSNSDDNILNLGLGFAFGLGLSILFRALGSGSDLSTIGGFQLFGWALAIWAAVQMRVLLRFGDEFPNTAAPSNPWNIVGLSIGISAVIMLAYFAFTAPNVIARWTDNNYLMILGILLLAMIIFQFLANEPGFWSALSQTVLWIWNILFVLALVITIFLNQVAFPPTQTGFPVAAPANQSFEQVPLFLMLLLSPVILVDFILYTRQIKDINPSLKVLGSSFALASLFSLIMVFAQVFTTVYDYIPVAGPFFRDRFWLVFLLAGIGLIAPLLLLKQESRRIENDNSSTQLPVMMGVIGVLAVSGAWWVSAKPKATTPTKNFLRVLTYNIQQGYSNAGQKNFDQQLALIRQTDPDIIGLEECDTNRIAGGNSDVVRYFADRLNYYSYYGPKTTTGTFGIALLSRYPIQNPETFFMYSIGEQTAAIHAEISIGGKTFNIFVTHLGNGGPIFQQEELLAQIGDLPNVIAMGDFNFRPDTEQYRMTTNVLADAWLLRWPEGTLDQGIDPNKRIDHIFVSPGTDIYNSNYRAGPQSDHPAMVAEIQW